MLARIPKRTIATALLLVICGLFVGACATQKDPPVLVNDPDAKQKESQLPWNQQEKWESEGQYGGLSGMSDRRTGSNH